MKRILIAMLIAASLLTACVVAPAGRGGHGPEGVTIAPLLPSVVVLDVEPYYVYSGFHYHYLNDRWYYSKSRRGPWADLPRDRYPKETRYKGKSWKHDRGRDDDRGHDNRGR